MKPLAPFRAAIVREEAVAALELLQHIPPTRDEEWEVEGRRLYACAAAAPPSLAPGLALRGTRAMRQALWIRNLRRRVERARKHGLID